MSVPDKPIDYVKYVDSDYCSFCIHPDAGVAFLSSPSNQFARNGRDKGEENVQKNSNCSSYRNNHEFGHRSIGDC